MEESFRKRLVGVGSEGMVGGDNKIKRDVVTVHIVCKSKEIKTKN